MDEKNFAAQLLDTLKKNSFAVKKILFNLEDCVSKEEFLTLEKNFQQIETELETVRKENLRLSKELSDSQQKLRRLETFEENYSELEAAYNSFLQLPEPMQFALAGVFGKKSSPVNFLAGALQEGHLESLFDYAANAVNQGKSQDEINILRELLEFTFRAVNSGRREEIYRQLDVQIGDDFDRETMRKTSSSRQSGTVNKIFLQGFKYTGGKIVRPSLISLA